MKVLLRRHSHDLDDNTTKIKNQEIKIVGKELISKNPTQAAF